MRGFFRRCLAVIFSALVTGAGQVFNRQPKKGLAVLALSALLVFIVGTFRLFSVFWGLVIWLSFEALFLVWVIVDSAVYGGLKATERPGFSKWRTAYLCATVLIVVNLVGAGTGFYKNYLLSGFGTRIDPSNSMAPTVQNGDRFMADVTCYRHRTPQRGEVVLFPVPGEGAFDTVKRIVAVGGDTIEATKDGVYLNGKRLNEPYARYNSPDVDYDTKRVFVPVKVPQGQLFVMGDNRDDSYDSRYYGTIPLSSIEGRLLYLFWARDKSRIGQVIR